jgi:hypothetical protein
MSRLAALTLILATVPAAALAAGPPAWAPNDISVSQTVPGRPGSANTHFEVGATGDARITVDLRDSSTHTTGTIVLIGGRWMLTRGFTSAGRKEIEALDVAALNSQLVIVLLTAALPGGPPAPGPPQHVRFAEKANPIRIATATASAVYGAPWTVTGSVTVSGANAPATYQLSFTCSEQGVAQTMEFAGSAGDAKSPVDLPDSMKLAGWKVRRLSLAKEPSPGSTQPPPKAATLGELRQIE